MPKTAMSNNKQRLKHIVLGLTFWPAMDHSWQSYRQWQERYATE